MPKIDVRQSTSAAWRDLNREIAPADQKLLKELVERAQLTDFTEIGGKVLTKRDLKKDAEVACKDLKSRHDEVWAQEWELLSGKTVVVVAHESDKGNLHVRFFNKDGGALKGVDGKSIAPKPFNIGLMYDGQD